MIINHLSLFLICSPPENPPENYRIQRISTYPHRLCDFRLKLAQAMLIFTSKWWFWLPLVQKSLKTRISGALRYGFPVMSSERGESRHLSVRVERQINLYFPKPQGTQICCTRPIDMVCVPWGNIITPLRHTNMLCKSYITFSCALRFQLKMKTGPSDGEKS